MTGDVSKVPQPGSVELYPGALSSHFLARASLMNPLASPGYISSRLFSLTNALTTMVSFDYTRTLKEPGRISAEGS